MSIELDHCFILVESEAKAADLLVSLGMEESFGRKHEGQGTSNRRFQFSNGMLEFLWLRDADEATNGPGRNLLIPERVNNPTASPFGVILHRKDNIDVGMPFDGWKYQPDYFDASWAFHVGRNSSNLREPLCIYVPFIEPCIRKTEEGIFKSISQVKIYTQEKSMSSVLSVAATADRLSIDSDDQHLMEITFDDNRCGMSKDLRPDIPLIVYW